jgi:hypothetical protein
VSEGELNQVSRPVVPATEEKVGTKIGEKKEKIKDFLKYLRKRGYKIVK